MVVPVTVSSSGAGGGLANGGLPMPLAGLGDLNFSDLGDLGDELELSDIGNLSNAGSDLDSASLSLSEEINAAL